GSASAVGPCRRPAGSWPRPADPPPAPAGTPTCPTHAERRQRPGRTGTPGGDAPAAATPSSAPAPPGTCREDLDGRTDGSRPPPRPRTGSGSPEGGLVWGVFATRPLLDLREHGAHELVERLDVVVPVLHSLELAVTQQLTHQHDGLLRLVLHLRHQEQSIDGPVFLVRDRVPVAPEPELDRTRSSGGGLV